MSDVASLARRGLLDAIEALADHRDALVVVGAQAIYLHTGEPDGIALAAFTTDGDLVVDPALLGTDPLLERALADGGFSPLEARGTRVIGSWVTDFGVAVDVMVPAAVAGAGTAHSRGVHAPPHDRYAMRRTRGLEGALIDYSVMTISAIDSVDDERSFSVKVAGPAALLVAKLHKVGDRLGRPGRSEDKDAHDIYRLLRAVDTAPFVAGLHRLCAVPVSQAVTAEALRILRDMFSASDAPGSVMAGRAEEGLGQPAQVSQAVAFLTSDLLSEFDH